MSRTVPEWIADNDDQDVPQRVRANARFGAWTVLSQGPNGVSRRTRWLCRCDCGTERLVSTIHLTRGTSKSCGCKRPRGAQSGRYKHGAARSSLHRIWCNIIQRCENPNNPAYADYGARGIAICEKWRNDFTAFAADMGPRPSPRHTIDRRENNRGYEPSNCRWATRTEQSRNRRNNRLVTLGEERIPLSEACERTGIPYGTAKWRLRNGRSDDEALS